MGLVVDVGRISLRKPGGRCARRHWPARRLAGAET